MKWSQWSRKWLLVAPLLLGGLVYAWFHSAEDLIEVLPCEDITQGCANADVQIKAMTTPKVMRAFEIRLEAESVGSVYASFEMKEMQMGLNRYRFQQQPDGSWRAMVTLPVCVSGRSDWLMRIDLKRKTEETKRYQLQFSAQP